MASEINKILLNVPQTLTDAQISNLKVTLAAVFDGSSGTSAITGVSVDASLTGDGTAASPLGVANYDTVVMTDDLENYYTKSETENLVTGKYDTTAFSAVSGSFLTAHQSLEGYATEDYVTSALDGKVDTSAIETFATEDYVVEALSGKLDTSSYSSQSATFLTAHQSLDGYATEAYVSNAVENKVDTSALDSYATKDDLDSKLDTSTYATQSATFLTAHQSLSSYYTKSEINSYSSTIDEQIAAKQDALSFANDADGNITAINSSAIAGLNSVTTDTKYITGDGTTDNPLTIDTTTEGSWGKYVEDKLATISSEFTIRGQLTNAEVSALTTPTIGDAYVLSDTGDLGTAGDIVVYTETGWVEMPTVSVDLDAYLKTTDAETIYQTKLTTNQLSAISSVSSKLDTTALDGYATEAYVTDALTGKLDITSYEADSATFLTAHQSLDGYATTDDLDSKLDSSAFSDVSGDFVTSATLTGDGLYSLRADGWLDISNSYYSKSESNGRFVTTGNVTSGDATKTSGNGQNFKFTFIPMDIVTETPTADDGVLHIILES